jgi:hypothetical protein
MATKLLKDVTRETYSVTDNKGNLYNVTLKAGDTIEFRAKGKRIRYEVPLQSVLTLSFIQFMEDQYKHKLKRYKERKALGLRSKRPKRPPKVFSKKMYEALRIN